MKGTARPGVAIGIDEETHCIPCLQELFRAMEGEVDEEIVFIVGDSDLGKIFAFGLSISRGIELGGRDLVPVVEKSVKDDRVGGQGGVRGQRCHQQQGQPVKYSAVHFGRSPGRY